MLAACGRQPQRIVLQGLAQGSYYAVTYFDEENRNFQPEIDSIFHAVDMSVNLWVDSSIISKVNRNEDVTLDSIFIDNFNIAQEAARLSDGYFDPTISPIVAAWGFSYKRGDSITPQLIDSLKQLVDYRKIRIENGKVIKENPNMKLDFNAIAQGYTSDMIAAFLESRGINNYLVAVDCGHREARRKHELGTGGADPHRLARQGLGHLGQHPKICGAQRQTLFSLHRPKDRLSCRAQRAQCDRVGRKLRLGRRLGLHLHGNGYGKVTTAHRKHGRRGSVLHLRQ